MPTNPRWHIIRTGPVDLGELPGFFDEDDPRPAAKQIHERNAHGGGWRPYEGAGLTLGKLYELKFADGPTLHPRAGAKLRQELIFLYDHSWLAIIQPDRSFEIARID